MLPLPLVLFTEPLDVFPPQRRSADHGAEEALEELERRHVPLIFASRGTRMQVEFVRRTLGNRHPFITENGGGLFVPEGYFRQRIPESVSIRHYHCISLARPYAETCVALEETAEEAGVVVVGFHNMSARELAENAGLPPRMADLARLREYDEPFFFAGDPATAERQLAEAARTRGWRVARGERFWHFSAGADVGAAVRRLMELYRAARHARLRSVAIGRSRHQFALLAAAGRAIVLPGSDGAFDEELAERLPAARRAGTGGAAGWNAAVMEVLGGKP
jgi:mannosyl-3-phosphoglycerate phosphatase